MKTENTPEYRLSELPAINLFKKLGYEYFDASQKEERENGINDVVILSRLTKALQRINPWLDEDNLKKAVHRITGKIQASSLMEANKEVHKLISASDFSIKQVLDGREQFKTVHFIDYDNPDNNDWLIVNQIKYKGKNQSSKPDIVVYLNGLPVGVLECKSPRNKEAFKEAIEDISSHYQVNSEKLFYYNQICAGIYRQGGKYGSVCASANHYSEYKSEDNTELETLIGNDITQQDILIYNLFRKDKLLDIIHNFIIFEIAKEGYIIKKLPRYQQIRATNKALEKLQKENEGGVVWHTQGSGKSITMLYLATKLRRESSGFNNPTIIILTDRSDLDAQIHSTLTRCGFPDPIRASSIKDLQNQLKQDYGKTITTTIQKFQQETENIDTSKVEPLSTKENLFILVDEAHRTQYGRLAMFMRKALPNAKYVAFTGTPIDKKEKDKNKSTVNTFYGGTYIDKYTIKESVEDGATLPIFYEAGLPQYFIEKEMMNELFENYFGDEEEEKQGLLKKEATSLRTFMLSKQRMNAIARHIINHYKKNSFANGLKAMLVCYNREQAIGYKKIFDEMKNYGEHKYNTKVVMSFMLKKDPPEFFNIAEKPENVKQATEDFILPFGDEDMVGTAGRKQFDNTAMIIVSDMLLTGYDAPIAQTLYLDKFLKEHTLLQAIARVNRTRTGKNAGYIVDYCGITENLVLALQVFSGDLEPEDVMQDIEAEKPELDKTHRELTDFFGEIKKDWHSDRQGFIDKAVDFLYPEDLRDDFKVKLSSFNKALDKLLPHPYAEKFLSDFNLYNELKLQARNRYTDEKLSLTHEDTKKLRRILDEHLRVSGIKNLLDKPASIIDPEKFKEEVSKLTTNKGRALKLIEGLKFHIKAEKEKDEAFYEPLSKMLEELVERRNQERIDEIESLKQLEELQKKFINKSQEAKDLGFTDEREFSIYNTLKIKLPEESSKTIATNLYLSFSDIFNLTGWKDNDEILKDMRMEIRKSLKDNVEHSEIKEIAAKIVDQLKRS